MIDECSALIKAETKEVWFYELSCLAKKLGFEEVLFGLKCSCHSGFHSAEVISNFKSRWRQIYQENDYVLVDPMVSHSLRTVSAIIWAPDVYVTSEQKAFHEEARLHGYNSGITLPLHGPKCEVGALSFNLGEAMDVSGGVEYIKSHYGALTLIRDLAFSRFLVLSQGFSTESADALKLTPKALEILKWSAQGKTSWEIAMICGCSEANVNFHLGNIRRALSVSSRKAAIIKAYALGIVQF